MFERTISAGHFREQKNAVLYNLIMSLFPKYSIGSYLFKANCLYIRQIITNTKTMSQL